MSKADMKTQTNFEEMPDGYYWMRPSHTSTLTQITTFSRPMIVSVCTMNWRRKMQRVVYHISMGHILLIHFKPQDFIGPIEPPVEWKTE